MPGRDWNEVHIREDCTSIKGKHDNGLFFGCKFDDLRGVSLTNCDLSTSQFVTDDIRKAMNFTMTLNCHSFRDIELSEELFDLYLALLLTTKGNDEKRDKLADVIGRRKAERLLSLLKRLE